LGKKFVRSVGKILQACQHGCEVDRANKVANPLDAALKRGGNGFAKFLHRGIRHGTAESTGKLFNALLQHGRTRFARAVFDNAPACI